VLLLVGMMVPCLAMAEEAGKAKEGTASEKSYYEDWHVLFYLPGWIPGIKGDVVTKGIKADLDVSIWQSIKNLQYLESIGLGHLEIKKGRWGLLMEGLYVKEGGTGNAATKIKLPNLAPGVEIPVSGKINLFSQMSIDEGCVLYDLYRSSSSVGNRAVLTIEALGGARYMYFRTKVQSTIVDPSGIRMQTLQGTQDWVDPILGGRLSWNLSDDWVVGFRADVGGFGLSSEITWNLDATVRYRITKWLNLNGGFRALYEDHESGSGRNKFKYAAWMYGPWLGVGVEF
jgi:hypothetical protein